MFLEKSFPLEKPPKVTQILQQYFFATFRQNSNFLKKNEIVFCACGANTFLDFGVFE